MLDFLFLKKNPCSGLNFNLNNRCFFIKALKGKLVLKKLACLELRIVFFAIIFLIRREKQIYKHMILSQLNLRAKNFTSASFELKLKLQVLN